MENTTQSLGFKSSIMYLNCLLEYIMNLAALDITLKRMMWLFPRNVNPPRIDDLFVQKIFVIGISIETFQLNFVQYCIFGKMSNSDKAEKNRTEILWISPMMCVGVKSYMTLCAYNGQQ
jgi:hypothetical protein